MGTTIRTTIIILFFWASMVSAQQPQELFLQANKAYDQGDFAEALRCYQSIKKKGPILLYNIGNCHYHRGDKARAIACWQRALKGASTELARDIEHNCTIAYHALAKEYHPARWDTFFIRYKVPLLIVQFLFLFCWLFLCILLWRLKKTWRIYVLMIGLIAMVFYLGLALWHCYERQTTMYGIVVEKNAPVYVGPHAQYHVMGTVNNGDTVHLIEQRSSWCKIAKDDVIGWIPSSTIEIVEQLC